MIIEVALGAIAGGAFSFMVHCLQRRPKAPKHRCPWTPCGYPLPETPLVEKPETSTHYASYASEECEGCGKVIIYDSFRGAYIRYQPTKAKGKSACNTPTHL